MMVQCKRCQKEFYIKPSHYASGHGIYCSRACSDLGRRRGKTVPCLQCKKKFYARPKQLRKSKKYFCTWGCYLKYKSIHLVWSGHPRWKSGENAYHELMLKKRKPICRRCGIRWLRVLVVHHIDKNRKNNVLSNLVWLCRNCHFLIHKYKETW